MAERTVAQNITLMVERLTERFDPQEIILFGSHARGTAGPDSDVVGTIIRPALREGKVLYVRTG